MSFSSNVKIHNIDKISLNLVSVEHNCVWNLVKVATIKQNKVWNKWRVTNVDDEGIHVRICKKRPSFLHKCSLHHLPYYIWRTKALRVSVPETWCKAVLNAYLMPFRAELYRWVLLLTPPALAGMSCSKVMPHAPLSAW